MKKILKYCILIFIIVIFISPKGAEPIEKLDIPIGIGNDMYKDKIGNNIYSVPISVYIFKNNVVNSSIIKEGRAFNLGDTRENRQIKSEKKYLSGLEKLYVIGEVQAREGIKSNIDIIFSNYQINDNGLVVVCKGKAIDILKYKIPGYTSSVDYLEGMIENGTQYNFLSNNYKLIDLYVRVDSEGRNMVLPYVEIKDNGLQIIGMALFKGDKMVKQIDMQDGKILNILRENNVSGIFNIQQSAEKSVSYKAKTKRTIKVYKNQDKYSFDIDISAYGDVISNQIYDHIDQNIDKQTMFERNMEENIKAKCYSFIDKMQKDYKVDCLELGRVAVAKYGTDKGIDWNEVVCNSKININVKVKVNNYGRGQY